MMKRSKKHLKITVTILVALLVLSPVGWFAYTRFCVDRYSISMDWNTITHQGDTYVPLNETYSSDEESQVALQYMTSHVGKNIGIAVFPKRSFTDLIWPVWVMEYDGDSAHRQIFVRGLMDVGSVYVKQP